MSNTMNELKLTKEDAEYIITVPSWTVETFMQQFGCSRDQAEFLWRREQGLDETVNYAETDDNQ